MPTPKIETIRDLEKAMANDPTVRAAFREDPDAALQKYASNEVPDTWIYRIVVLALGLTVVFIVLGVIILIALGHVTEDKSVPTILTAIGSGAIGALSGLLAPSPKK